MLVTILKELLQLIIMFTFDTRTLLQVVKTIFSEVGYTKKDCKTSWIRYVLYSASFPSDRPPEILLKGKPAFKNFFKAKLDFVKEPIPETGIEGLGQSLLTEDRPLMIWDPYGGKMSQFSESDRPFPHSNRTLYKIQYLSVWQDGDKNAARHIDWVRKHYQL